NDYYQYFEGSGAWRDDPVGAAEEIERVIPVVKALVAEIDLPVSIDTYKAEVAAAARAAFATIGG
ncbi:MAG: dihydropteroate synthase, partial [Trueperaceae bacterium]|nr:dihydropteroate synthase [Trueperaceae bacterium]